MWNRLCEPIAVALVGFGLGGKAARRHDLAHLVAVAPAVDDDWAGDGVSVRTDGVTPPGYLPRSRK